MAQVGRRGNGRWRRDSPIAADSDQSLGMGRGRAGHMRRRSHHLVQATYRFGLTGSEFGQTDGVAGVEGVRVAAYTRDLDGRKPRLTDDLVRPATSVAVADAIMVPARRHWTSCGASSRIGPRASA